MIAVATAGVVPTCTVTSLERLPEDGGASCVPGRECCDNGADDDGDGLVDCADPDCDGAARPCATRCGTGTERCVEGAPVGCSARAPAAEANEGCFDGQDNDCDGTTDCADGDCDAELRPCGTACGGGKEACLGGAMRPCDAPVPAREDCENQVDDDCDGKVDCQDSECDGTSVACSTACGTGSRVCQGGIRGPCSARTPKASENGVDCNNKSDDDCNSRTDCADPSCVGALRDCTANCGGGTVVGSQQCGPDGGWRPCAAVCDGGVAGCIPAAAAESGATCDDLVDNDCDGKPDCSDPDCAGAARLVATACGTDTQQCVGGLWMTSLRGCAGTCCGASCANLTSDPAHCGNCANACPAGQSCVSSTCCAGQACGSACCTASDCCAGACCPGIGDKCVAGACCPSTRTCGAACCPAGVACCSGRCCSLGEQCLNGACCGNAVCGGFCCPNAGDICVGNACCPFAQACGSVCCASGETCRSDVCCPSSMSFASDVQPLFTAKCESCHAPQDTLPDLRAGSAYTAIVNRAPDGKKCSPLGAGGSFSGSWKLVAPGDLGNSVLWWYLQDCCGPICLSPPCSGAQPRCGNQDPICFNSRPTPAEKRSVQCWILQGAPNN